MFQKLHTYKRSSPPFHKFFPLWHFYQLLAPLFQFVLTHTTLSPSCKAMNKNAHINVFVIRYFLNWLWSSSYLHRKSRTASRNAYLCRSGVCQFLKSRYVAQVKHLWFSMQLIIRFILWFSPSNIKLKDLFESVLKEPSEFSLDSLIIFYSQSSRNLFWVSEYLCLKK